MPHSVLQARRRLQAAAPRLPLAPPSHTSSTAALGGPTWRRTPPRSHPAVPVAIPRGQQREHRGRPLRAHLRVAPRGDARLRASGEYEPLLSIVPRARLPLAAPARRIPSRSRITWTRGDASCHRTTRTCLSSGAVAEVVFVNLGRDREENGLFGFVELYISEKETDSSCDM